MSHGERLAGPGDAHEGLKGLSLLKRCRDFFDRLRLIALGLEGADDLEFGHNNLELQPKAFYALVRQQHLSIRRGAAIDCSPTTRVAGPVGFGSVSESPEERQKTWHLPRSFAPLGLPTNSPI